MAVAPGAMALLGMLMTSDQPEAPQPHPYAGQTWKVDDLHPGSDLNSSGGTEPYYMRALDGKLYFRGTADGSERELYVYDPVAGTTEAVAGADLWNSGIGTFPQDMHALDGELYFSGNNGSDMELYVYDPVVGTTTKIVSADINNSGTGTAPHSMRARPPAQPH